MPAIRHAIRSYLCFALLSLGLLGGAAPAWAQTGRTATRTPGALLPPSNQDEIARLVRAGQLDEASARLTSILNETPNHPQMLFFKGMIENERGQKDEAYATFLKLTQDFPELPEPYNNLAVLEAALNRLPEALALLETAIRLNPDYATAHQNLGDIHARLAALSYARSLELEPGNPILRPRIASLNQMLARPVDAR